MILFAMDRATVRRVDANGFLHVERSNISKANVCPYYGREVPGWEALGLDPERVYQFYRDPDELARGAASFNNLPILSQHVPISSDDLPQDLIVGSTGTDAAMDGPYLTNSLVIYEQGAIDGIELNRKRELSSAYRWRPDMTAGEAEGLFFDGVMRDIIGNHVALVFEGRAGPDVLVGDEAMKLKSRTALMISGALAASVRPLLAKEAKVDISTALKGVDAKSIAMDGAPAKLADAVAAIVKPHLAADASLDMAALAASIAAIQPLALDEDMIDEEKKAEDGDTEDEDDDKAMDEEGNDDADDKPAMDSVTVKKLIADAEKRGAARVAAIDAAKRDVKQLVGEVIGMDSAEAIYRFALDSAGYDPETLKGVPAAALKAMVEREASLKTGAKPAPVMAQDGADKLSKAGLNLPPVKGI